MSNARYTIVAGLLGGVLGLIAGTLLSVKAQAAVQVRPRLGIVSFWDALLSGHGTDWLFFHYTTPAIFAAAALLSGVCALVLWYIQP